MWPSTHAILRIGWRSIGRHRWRSLLIGVLVFLPVAAMVGGLTFYRTITPTGEENATSYMGRADLLVGPVASDATRAELVDVLPAGSRVDAILWTDGGVSTGRGQARVTMRALDPHGLAEGIITLVDGRLPATRGEVAASAAALTLAGTELGGAVASEAGEAWTVVGLVETPQQLSSRFLLLHPSVAEDAPPGTPGISWLVGLSADVDESIFDELRFVPAFRWQAASPPGDVTIGMLVFGALALTETALVAAAAFAVGTRRRQRELGMLAAAGATARQLRNAVLAEGMLIGGAAALAGASVGLAVTTAVSPWLDSVVDRRVGPVLVNPTGISLAVVLGTASAIIAALGPARTAARVPILLALSGRRPPTSPARRTLVVGIVLVASAAALTATGSASIFTSRAGAQSSDPGFFMLLAGAILGLVGFGAMSPFLVERLEGISRRLPLAARMAVRETARARTRSAATVTAMLASMAFAFAAISYIASYVAIDRESRAAILLDDQVIIYGPDAETVLPDVVAAADPLAAAMLPRLVFAQDRWGSPELVYGTGPEPVEIVHHPDGGWSCPDCAGSAWDVTVADPQLLVALAAEAAAAPLARGEVVLLLPAPMDLEWVTVDGPSGSRAHTASAVVAGYREGFLPGVVVSPATAEELGLVAGYTDRAVIRLRHPVSDSDIARVSAAAGAGTVFIDWADGPASRMSALRGMLVGASVLLALTVAAIAVALGESESRPDQRTLLAVGASPGIRRRIAAARAAVLAVLASILALPAGLLPVWGLVSSMNERLVVPMPEIAAVAVLLPVVAIAAVLLLSPPIPPWSAFREVSTS